MIDRLEQHVDEFMRDANQEVLDEPGIPTRSSRALRLRLLREELNELTTALINADHANITGNKQAQQEAVVEVADALADIIYVAVGGFRAFGIKGSRVMDEVCRSNDTKRDPKTGGFTLDQGGKVTKPDHFQEPRIWETIYNN